MLGRKVTSLAPKALDQEDRYQPLRTKRKVKREVERVVLQANAEGIHHKSQHKGTLIGQNLEMMLQVLHLHNIPAPILSRLKLKQCNMDSWVGIKIQKKESSEKLRKLVK